MASAMLGPTFAEDCLTVFPLLYHAMPSSQNAKSNLKYLVVVY